jgi:small subunit ribosomal protein S4e
MGPKKVPYIITHDARTIRYPDPHIKSNDTIQVDIATGKIQEHIKFDTGIFFQT